MAEGITVACRLDNLTACRIDVPPGHTGLAGGNAGKLCVQHRVVHGLHLVGDMTDRDRARHIRAVAVVNAAEVHRHEIARLDGLFTRYAMRLGAVRARNDDRVKRHVLRAIVQHEVGQPCRDLLLGHADLDVVQYLLERLLRDALCRDDLLNLVLFLAHAQLLHTVLETDSCRVQCRAPRHELRIGKRFVLESDLFRAVLVKQLIDKRRIALPRLDLAHLKILDGRVCRFNITEIREEYRLLS